ncbi:MAG: hypothetical protein ABI581_12515, partial [Sediminibacterium sp.]
MKIGIIVPKDYRLLSIAAILDVFEAVNRIYIDKGKTPYYEISLFGADEADGNGFHGYPFASIKTESNPELILIPSFSTADMQQTIGKNAVFIPWLIKQYQNGAELGSFCTGAFLLG